MVINMELLQLLPVQNHTTCLQSEYLDIIANNARSVKMNLHRVNGIGRILVGIRVRETSFPEKSWTEKPVFIAHEQTWINFREMVCVEWVSVHFFVALWYRECIFSKKTFQVVPGHILIWGEEVELHIWPSGCVTISSEEVCLWVWLWVRKTKCTRERMSRTRKNSIIFLIRTACNFIFGHVLTPLLFRESSPGYIAFWANTLVM